MVSSDWNLVLLTRCKSLCVFSTKMSTIHGKHKSLLVNTISLRQKKRLHINKYYHVNHNNDRIFICRMQENSGAMRFYSMTFPGLKLEWLKLETISMVNICMHGLLTVKLGSKKYLWSHILHYSVILTTWLPAIRPVEKKLSPIREFSLWLDCHQRSLWIPDFT